MVSEKGQVTIPKEYREKFGIRSGDEVEFIEKDGELVVKKQKTSFDDYAGYLGEGDTDEFMERMRGRR
ncbi:MAG: AbrB/MazE/SpoVT family DNA-binding domain-containing protein [Candidatus Nanohaloarchaea archaeon]|nr:AbrB/MazE/SpoVT family DNA-binding domain-containing protein [Candidatus Nanohaloarchaea archaeon]